MDEDTELQLGVVASKIMRLPPLKRQQATAAALLAAYRAGLERAAQMADERAKDPLYGMDAEYSTGYYVALAGLADEIRAAAQE